jgi:hypothetical protein
VISFITIIFPLIFYHRDVGGFATKCILIMQAAAQQQQQQIASFSSTCNCCFFSVKVCWLSDWGCHTIILTQRRYIYKLYNFFTSIIIENKYYIYIYMNPIWLTIGFVLYSFVGKVFKVLLFCKINPFLTVSGSELTWAFFGARPLLLGCSSNYSTSYILLPFVVKALTNCCICISLCTTITTIRQTCLV